MKFGRKVRAAFTLPYLPVWLVPVILIGPIIVTGKAIFWGTPFLQFAPWRTAAWEILSSGHWPLWDPWVGMGAPLAANYQSALFYPPNWLLLLLQALGGNAWQAWGQAVILLAHLIWAGLGMVYFTRQLGLGRTSQMVAGLAFGSSSYLLDRSGFLSINTAAAWVPWVLAGANRIRGPQLVAATPGKPERFPRFLLLAGAFGMQLLTGHAQISWYTGVFAAAWVVVWGVRHQNIRSLLGALGQFCLGIGLAVGIAAIQLAPTAEFLLQSQRSSAVGIENALNYSFWPWQLLTLIAPDFFGSPVRGDYWFNAWFWEDAVYIGLLPFIAGVAFWIKTVLKRSREPGSQADDRKALSIFLGIAILASFLIAFGRYTPVFPFLYRYVPSFSMFQAPARFSLLAVVSLVLLGSLGVESWTAPAGRALYWTRLSLAGALAMLLGAGAGWLAIRGVHATFIRALTFTAIWGAGTAALSLLFPKTKPSASSWWPWGVAILLGADLIAAGWGAQPSINRQYYSAPLESIAQVKNLVEDQRIFIDQQSESSLQYNQYLLVNNYNPGKDWSGFKAALLPDSNLLFGVASANNFDPLVPDNYAFWLEKLNGLNPSQRGAFLRLMDAGAVETIDPQNPYLPHFEPVSGSARFRWGSCAKTAADNAQAWDLLAAELADKSSPEGVPVVILDKASQLGSSSCSSKGVARIHIINENSNGVTLQVEAGSPGWLLQADTWYPGWAAEVDGLSTQIYPADVAFRAVSVPAGTHLVRIEYRPLSFRLGAAATATSFLGLAILGLCCARRKPDGNLPA